MSPIVNRTAKPAASRLRTGLRLLQIVLRGLVKPSVSPCCLLCRSTVVCSEIATNETSRCRGTGIPVLHFGQSRVLPFADGGADSEAEHSGQMIAIFSFIRFTRLH